MKRFASIALAGVVALAASSALAGPGDSPVGKQQSMVGTIVEIVEKGGLIRVQPISDMQVQTQQGPTQQQVQQPPEQKGKGQQGGAMAFLVDEATEIIGDLSQKGKGKFDLGKQKGLPGQKGDQATERAVMVEPADQVKPESGKTEPTPDAGKPEQGQDQGGKVKPEPGQDAGKVKPEPGQDSGKVKPEPGQDAGKVKPEPGQDSGKVKPEPGQDSGKVKPEPGQDSGKVKPEPGQDSGKVKPEPGQDSGKIPQGQEHGGKMKPEGEAGLAATSKLQQLQVGQVVEVSYVDAAMKGAKGMFPPTQGQWGKVPPAQGQVQQGQFTPIQQGQFTPVQGGKIQQGQFPPIQGGKIQQGQFPPLQGGKIPQGQIPVQGGQFTPIQGGKIQQGQFTPVQQQQWGKWGKGMPGAQEAVMRATRIRVLPMMGKPMPVFNPPAAPTPAAPPAPTPATPAAGATSGNTGG